MVLALKAQRRCVAPCRSCQSRLAVVTCMCVILMFGLSRAPCGFRQVLELEFSTIKGPARGLRELTREQWDAVLTDAKCSILCNMSNHKFDSYVLSESSLFVYPHTAILKTCGTTTLLRCIARLLSYTEVRTKRLSPSLEMARVTRP